MIKMYNNPMKKRTVYRLFDSAGNVYTGSTSQKLSRRFTEHRSTKKKDFDWSTAKIEPICHTEKFAQLEESLIKKTKNELGDKCKNKGLGCFGPIGVIVSDKNRKKRSDAFKKMWKTPEGKALFKKGKLKSDQVNCYFEMSKKSHELRWSKMPEWYAIEKETGKKFGPYRGYFVAKKEMVQHPDTLKKCLLKGQQNRKFNFFFSGGNP